ncbi:MAG: EAL domain-containing protein [Roseitalea porphyridii]|jgi:diguanylate cyclase (GGDEF)-like protein/PAS domain S-box-containing protein|uniref:sensor domain-containing phosphodiesterase n=1 Tax=Alphaproteobacteria TaxID=28211 RepID=UPI0032ED1415
MKLAPMPTDEADRVATLRRYAILDTGRESAFDRITDFAARQFDVPIALVSLVDENRQWFKASCGLGESQTPRDLAFCAWTILGDGVHYVPDATKDERFADNPLVTGDLGIRFYCGAPLIAANGHRLGSLCLIDQKPRPDFSEEDQRKLADLAAIVVDQMEMRIASGNVLGEIRSRQEAESEAAATKRQMRALIENTPASIALIDREGRFLASSRSWRAYAEEMEGELAAGAEKLDAAVAAALRGESLHKHEDRICTPSGKSRWFTWESRPWLNENGIVEGAIVWHAEITSQVEARMATEQQAETLRAVLENVSDGIVACDADGRLTIFNRKTRELHGIDRTDIAPEQCAEYYSLYEADGKTPLSVERIPLFAALYSGRARNQEIVIAPENLPARTIITHATPLFGKDGEKLGAVASMTDVTDARIAERQLRASEAQANHIAFHDSLTGLPNRAHFMRMAEEKGDCLKDAMTAAIFLDLNQFKAVNDTLGHKVGDDLLRRTAATLRALAGEDAFVTRLGGDEFVLFKSIDSHSEAIELGKRITDEIGKPVMINGQTVSTGAAVGIALGPDHGTDHEELLRRADLAMYKAKQTGEGGPVLFDPVHELEAVSRRALEMDLQTSIERGEFEVYFQPIVDGRTQTMRGVEALARWHHPERGLVSPAEFIPVAEESGFIVQLGEWVLREAMHTLKGQPDLFVSVNLSPVQFRDAMLVERVFRAIDETGFDPTRLELEITEGLLIYDARVARRTIELFKARGIRIALDDFGTGYSSLGYIQSFPFDKIKIDRSFIADIETNAQSAAVVQCVVNLASSLGMVVTAEGIETSSHEMLLKFIGCDTLQGYRYGKPVPFGELEQGADMARQRRA